MRKLTNVGSRCASIPPNSSVPPLTHAQVKAVCEQQTKDKKVIVFKKKKRKGYRRRNGFRRQITVLRVTKVGLQHDQTDSEPTDMHESTTA